MEKEITFNLHNEEKIVATARKHWLAFAMPIISIFVMFLIFVIALLVIVNFTNILNVSDARNISDNIGTGIFLIIGSIYLLSLVGYFYISWLDYYLDVFVITNERIIRLEQIVLFGRKVSEASFHHVQDSSSQVKGVLASILNVGTIFVETAGERENFAFKSVKNPDFIARKILDLQRNLWEKEGMKDNIIASNILPHNIIKKEEVLEAPAEQNDNIKPLTAYQEILQEKDEDKKEISFERKNNSIAPSDSDYKYNPRNHKIEESAKKIEENIYKDGRKITEEGVIWQADQEINQDILETLNRMRE